MGSENWGGNNVVVVRMGVVRIRGGENEGVENVGVVRIFGV
jgi:hypothetical protein